LGLVPNIAVVILFQTISSMSIPRHCDYVDFHKLRILSSVDNGMKAITEIDINEITKLLLLKLLLSPCRNSTGDMFMIIKKKKTEKKICLKRMLRWFCDTLRDAICNTFSSALVTAMEKLWMGHAYGNTDSVIHHGSI